MSQPQIRLLSFPWRLFILIFLLSDAAQPSTFWSDGGSSRTSGGEGDTPGG